MYAFILLATVILVLLAYRWYGRFLSVRCGLDPKRPTPAHTSRDGIDFVPTRTSTVFGHHFSSIAGSGPIVGPILAGLYFGWGPAWLWILLGAIFVGGVHDFGSALVSVRNRGDSIARVSRSLIGTFASTLFMIFVLLALVYVLVVFLDLTATTFAGTPQVATASGWFILMAVLFGQLASRKLIPYGMLVAAFVPLTFLGLALGEWLPISAVSKEFWLIALLVYALIAAVLPVSWLLQPRDFLSSFFLFAVLLCGLAGALLALPTIELPMFKTWHNELASPAYLMPALFITVACGACSGFHCMVASGTTSKQLDNELDIRRVGYGAMLVEGVLATLALGTIMVLTTAEISQAATPVAIFAAGLGKILAPLGFAGDFAVHFALLAISTFMLTTLDTCTRLCRFLVEELTGWRSVKTRVFGTILVLLIPGFLVFQSFEVNGRVLPVWQAVWPLFGSTNQMMAALALISLVVYLRANRIKSTFAFIPAIFMLVMPLAALVLMLWQHGPNSLLGGISAGMLVLAVTVAGRAIFVLFQQQAHHPLEKS